eukprot:1530678-Alexandrium_andersonii.AAC.1
MSYGGPTHCGPDDFQNTALYPHWLVSREDVPPDRSTNAAASNGALAAHKARKRNSQPAVPQASRK